MLTLDLLWYLIKKDNIDILDIPIAKIAKQYVNYIETMPELELEAAADYLVMAELLAEIKSRMLLPKSEQEIEEEDDPRAELVRKLQEYEQFKIIAKQLDEIPRLERDVFNASMKTYDIGIDKPQAEISMDDLLKVFEKVLRKTKINTKHFVQHEPMTVREKMVGILEAVSNDSFCDFADLFDIKDGKSGIVVTFIAILELIKQNMLQLIQAEPFQPIHVKKV